MSLLRVPEEGTPNAFGTPRHRGSPGEDASLEGWSQAKGGEHPLQASSG